ncbi:MAG: hypothetical protein E7599_04135 [Ruminococcaceae bacterium]|nr:hypothetical protein [Oscillospiraceae bacterium]
MKKKRVIIAGIFLTLIAFTVICAALLAVKSYQYDMENGVDIMESMGAAMITVLGGFSIVYEIDLFYTVYYFFIKPKTVAKSVLNILSNVCLLCVIWSDNIADCLSINEESNVTVALILIYFTLRCVYAFASLMQEERRY